MAKRSLLPGRGRLVALGVSAIAIVVAACSSSRGIDTGSGQDSPDASTPPLAEQSTPRVADLTPKYFAGPADTSQSVVQRGPRVDVSLAVSSRPFRDIVAPATTPEAEELVHEVRMNPHFQTASRALVEDPVLQANVPVLSMPATLLNLNGQGTTLEGCVFPNPPAGCTTTGDPPDTNGAVGPNHYVQTVNGGIAIWNKNGTILQAPKKSNLLWAGYPTTDGNQCAARNDGDPVVVYDQLADRWFITQFNLPNIGTNSAPSFQCIAVSKTPDPTGAYSLYDFKYNVFINDYGKFSVWPDGYYATFNMFSPFSSLGANFCAYDRANMLLGNPATQVCFQQASTVFGVLSSNLDGFVKPPAGEPAFFLGLGAGSSVNLWKFHADFATPANSTVTGPTAIPVAPFTITCANNLPRHACVPQPAPGNVLESLADRPMFRLTYRNFGTHESLLANHAVSAGGASGIRWYEIRSPNNGPTVFQQSTYAPADGNWRWMASLAEDQAEGFGLGFSVSSGTKDPSIGWTGRLASDPVSTMGQGEAIFDTGTGVETGTFSNGQAAQRWGDYSNMTVDPADDCTFWYTQELYKSSTSPFVWDTQIATFKFPNCAANDFSISIAPATQNVPQGSSVPYAITTTSTKGAPENIVFTVQDLPAGVSGVFAPANANAGTPSTLTLTATAAAPLTAPVTFTVIGKAPSAVHAATAKVGVVNCGATGAACCQPGNTCVAGDVCSGGTCTPCGAVGQPCCATSPACTGAAPDTCHGPASCNAASNTCTNPVLANGTTCNNGNLCQTNQVCNNGACAGTPVVCAPLDQCHVAGTCAPATGLCSNPNATDGTACTGANKCLSSQTCTAGVCGGGIAKTCTPLDQCHVAGTCDSATGNCSNPPIADGTVCTSANKCLTSPKCTAGVCGGTAVTCTAQDQCHSVGTCDTTTGTCSNPTATDGTACTSANKCLTNTVCTAGACGGAPVTCTAQDECHDVGTCDSSSGACSNPTKADGTPCSVGTCQSGTCTRPPVDAGADSGSGGNDAGHPADSGARDSGNSGGGDASAGDAGDTGGVGNNGGCGCRTVRSDDSSPSLPLVGFGGLAFVGALRFRRRRRS